MFGSSGFSPTQQHHGCCRGIFTAASGMAQHAVLTTATFPVSLVFKPADTKSHTFPDGGSD